MRCQIVQLIEERHVMTFISDQAYDDHTACKKFGQNKSHRLNTGIK